MSFYHTHHKETHHLESQFGIAAGMLDSGPNLHSDIEVCWVTWDQSHTLSLTYGTS